MSSSLGRLEDLPPQYVSGLRERNVVPLWPSLRDALPYDKPGRKTQPSLWRYSQLRPEQNNSASSLTNLFRNWGGSFGIAFATTEATRRQDFHQSNLVSHLDSGSQVYQQMSHAVTGYLMQHGFTKADASAGVAGVVYNQIARQSLFLAFMDCFRVIGWVTLATIPLVLAIRSFKTAGGNVSAH